MANWVQNVKNLGSTISTIEKKKAQAAQPTYTELTDYLDTAKTTLPGVSKQANVTATDIRSTPEYAAASTKTTIDPAYYTNKWDTASTEIQDTYAKKGGYYDRMLGNLNERGLANSGEYNYQTRAMGEDLATELATARQGIETEAMGKQAEYDQAYTTQMGNLLGQVTSNDQYYTSLNTQIDQYNKAQEWAEQTGQTDLAKELSDARNQLITEEYNRAAEEGQYEDTLEADKLQRAYEIFSNAELEDSQKIPALRALGYTDAEIKQIFGLNTSTGESANVTYPWTGGQSSQFGDNEMMRRLYPGMYS